MNNPISHIPIATDNKYTPSLPKILLVEDNAITQRLHQRFLERLGCQVKPVVSADAQQPQLQACLGAHQVHAKPINLPVLGKALQDCGIVVDILRNYHDKLAHQSYLKKLGFQGQSSA